MERGGLNYEMLSALNLAYLGDAVFELLVRVSLLQNGGGRTGDMTKQAGKIVRAASQSDMYHRLLPVLTEEEVAVLKRGRNASAKSRPKSASVSEYRHATGVEALFGYLYIMGRDERIQKLFDLCISNPLIL